MRSLEFYNRLGLMLSFLLVFLVGGWAAFASIGGAIITSASVVVERGTQTIQHLEGGIVSRIHVRDGQSVQQGAVLVELDTTKAQSRAKYLNAQIKSLNSQLTLIDEQLKGLAELFEKGLSRKSELLVTRRRRVELSGRRDESLAQLKAVRDEVDRAAIKAPIPGAVHELKVHTIGGVIQPGETILQVIPADGRLTIAARLEPRSIDQVKVGQTAVLRFTSFDQRTTPELNGKVELVAADLSQDQPDLPPYYKVRIGIGADQLKRLGGKQLRPGMPAEAFIRTNPRSVISYFVKPLTDQFERSLRE
ncbi:MAG: HlyD family efflux transporter periplasmic adaptor subunit [Hyphomicrobiaceae bacterium]